MTRAKRVAEPLTAAAFAPFGAVLALDQAVGRSVNEGRGIRCDLPDLDHSAPACRFRLALYDIAPSGPIVPVRLFERHPLSAQLFVPLAGATALIVATRTDSDGGPDVLRARAFLAYADQAVIYRAGIWHMPLAALDKAGRFLMAMWEAGSADDCIEAAPSALIEVVTPGKGDRP
jgi:ureidoglycolate lyase